MTESSYYADLTKYYTKTATNSVAWEAKFTRSNRIPFSCLAPHQEEKLLQSERAYGLKIPDAGIMQKPFDGFVLYKATTIFVAIYFLPRKTLIYEIPLRSFLHEKYTSTEKSLSKERAAEIATKILDI